MAPGGTLNSTWRDIFSCKISRVGRNRNEKSEAIVTRTQTVASSDMEPIYSCPLSNDIDAGAGTPGINTFSRRKLLRLALSIIAAGKSAHALMRGRTPDAIPPFPYPIPTGDMLSTCNFEHGMSSLIERTIQGIVRIRSAPNGWVGGRVNATYKDIRSAKALMLWVYAEQKAEFKIELIGGFPGKKIISVKPGAWQKIAISLSLSSTAVQPVYLYFSDIMEDLYMAACFLEQLPLAPWGGRFDVSSVRAAVAGYTACGIHDLTGFPHDVISDAGVVGAYTQPAAIGFYLQYLLTESAPDRWGRTWSAVDGIDRQIRKILLYLTTLQNDSSIAWRGLLPWLKLSPNGVMLDRDEIAFGDNIMLSMSVAMVLGAGEIVKPETAALAQDFLNRQRSEGGYLQLFDGARGLLRGAVDRQGQPQNQYYMDRFFNEFRSGVAFAVAYFGVDERAWSNLALLSHEMKPYFASRPAVSASHEVINYVTWNGSAHQLSWPLLFLPEHELNRDLAVAHANALFTMLDSAQRQELLGVPAASAVPSTGGYLYSGEHGEAVLAESTSNSAAVRSIYGLAPYYNLLDDAGRSTLVSWFGAYASEPGMRGRYGLFDAVDLEGRIAEVNLAIDSLTTALIGSPAPGYLVRFLESEHVMNAVSRLYSWFRGTIPAVDADLPVPLVPVREPWPISSSIIRRTHPT
jgi:hypothetical protein